MFREMKVNVFKRKVTEGRRVHAQINLGRAKLNESAGLIRDFNVELYTLCVWGRYIVIIT